MPDTKKQWEHELAGSNLQTIKHMLGSLADAAERLSQLQKQRPGNHISQWSSSFLWARCRTTTLRMKAVHPVLSRTSSSDAHSSLSLWFKSDRIWRNNAGFDSTVCDRVTDLPTALVSPPAMSVRSPIIPCCPPRNYPSPEVVTSQSSATPHQANLSTAQINVNSTEIGYLCECSWTTELKTRL